MRDALSEACHELTECQVEVMRLLGELARDHPGAVGDKALAAMQAFTRMYAAGQTVDSQSKRLMLKDLGYAR